MTIVSQAKRQKTRITESFLQAAKWAGQDRRKSHPGKDRDTARRSLMEACKWADALVKRWDAAGQPGLMAITSGSQLEFEICSEALLKCFA